MQRKRSSDELGEPPAMLAGHTSKRGRVVKPKLWDDGTEAPIAMGGSKLARRTPPPKEDSGPSSGSDRPRSASTQGSLVAAPWVLQNGGFILCNSLVTMSRGSLFRKDSHMVGAVKDR